MFLVYRSDDNLFKMTICVYIRIMNIFSCTQLHLMKSQTCRPQNVNVLFTFSTTSWLSIIFQSNDCWIDPHFVGYQNAFEVFVRDIWWSMIENLVIHNGRKCMRYIHMNKPIPLSLNEKFFCFKPSLLHVIP